MSQEDEGVAGIELPATGPTAGGPDRSQGVADAQPLLFISHKHLDADLAAVVKDWVIQRTAGKVRVYLSSDASAEGPGIGMNLDDELQAALWEAAVVLLLYTEGDYDWSYCMYECGVATDPKSPHTRVFVLQCGDDVPSPFADKVRVRVTPEEIGKFAVGLLTQDEFFYNHPAVTPFDAESTGVKDAAADLWDKMEDHLPKQKSGANVWPTWPTFRIELSQAAIANIKDMPGDERLDATRELLLTEGRVVEATAGAAMLFGRNELTDPVPVAELVSDWTTEYPDRRVGWFDCLCNQLIIGAERKKAPTIAWETMREVGGPDRHLVGAGTVEVVPADGTMLFTFHFYEHSTTQPVTAFMTRLSKIEKINLDKKPATERRLEEILTKLEDGSWNRIPIVSDGDQLRYIVHVSMIDRFVRQQAFGGEDIETLTLEDLLADEEMKAMFESTFVVVGKDATIVDANHQMDGVEGCEDIFVTENGSPDEAVIGWLTDKDIAEALDAAIG